MIHLYTFVLVETWSGGNSIGILSKKHSTLFSVLFEIRHKVQTLYRPRSATIIQWFMSPHQHLGCFWVDIAFSLSFLHDPMLVNFLAASPPHINSSVKVPPFRQQGGSGEDGVRQAHTTLSYRPLAFQQTSPSKGFPGWSLAAVPWIRAVQLQRPVYRSDLSRKQKPLKNLKQKGFDVGIDYTGDGRAQRPARGQWGIQRLQRQEADTAAEQMGGGRVAELRGIVTRCRLDPLGPAPQQLEPERLCSCRKGGEVTIPPSLPPSASHSLALGKQPTWVTPLWFSTR